METITEQDLEYELRKILQSQNDRAKAVNDAIIYCQNILESYRSNLIQNGFEDEPSEIQFFKVEKQVPLSYFIYYSMVQSFELKFGPVNMTLDKVDLQSHISDINRFRTEHQTFVQYMNLGQNYLDRYYFMREFRNTTIFPKTEYYPLDPDFNSACDLLLGKLNAYSKFHSYLLNSSNEDFIWNKGAGQPIRFLEWTASKVSLTELAFALNHAGVFNYGKASINEIVQWVENATGFDLGDYHHTSLRFRNRSNPTKFLDELKGKLLLWIHSLDA